MLSAYPTKKGTGISIYGDYGDLHTLYQMVHQVTLSLNEAQPIPKAHNELLMNFAYEIRHAYSGHRLTEKISYDDGIELQSYGFRLIWPDILIYLSVLRFCAGFSPTSKLHQSMLYMLEYLVEKALFDYDPEGANTLKNYISQQINIHHELAWQLYQAAHFSFIYQNPGKQRFRKIPSLISDHFSTFSNEHKKIMASIEVYAKNNNCTPQEVQLQNEYPEIEW